MTWLVETVMHTNLAAAACAEWTYDLTRGELLVWLGIICFFLVYPPFGRRRNHWMSDTSSTVFPFANLSRFMSRRRFELTCTYITPGDNGDPTDKLRYYRGFIDAVQERFRRAVRPGR